MTRERYERLRAREYDLIMAIKAIQRRAVAEAAPLADELCRLREHRDPPVVTLSDATQYQYTGPRPAYALPGEEKNEIKSE